MFLLKPKLYDNKVEAYTNYFGTICKYNKEKLFQILTVKMANKIIRKIRDYFQCDTFTCSKWNSTCYLTICTTINNFLRTEWSMLLIIYKTLRSQSLYRK